MTKIIFTIMLTIFLGGVAFGAGETVILAPNEGYCSRLGEVWVVVRAPQLPEVLVDGKKVNTPIKSVGDIRHLLITGVRPQGSEVKVSAGGTVQTLKVRGYESSGKPSKAFHTTGWSACQECHEYKFTECRSCHRFEGHKHADYLKCGDCHGAPGVVPVAAQPLCANCHKDATLKSHKKLRHPISAATDPKRPGRVFDCVSCHNPHTPRCMDGMKKSEEREWCKNCHSR